MKKPAKSNIIDRLKAKPSPGPIIGFGDMANLCFAARQALARLAPKELAEVTNSLLRVEAILAEQQANNAPATPPSGPQPEAKPADTAAKPADR